MKRTKLAKQSKMPISKLQRKIWQLCKQLTRKRYGNVCYTCGLRDLSGTNWHTGHMWAKASLGAYLKYDLRVLRPQCMTCNVWQGGRGADFYAKMLREIGEEKMAELQKDRQKTVRAYEHYEQLLKQYQEILKSY